MQTCPDNFAFGRALEALEEGRFVARHGWNAHHYLGLQTPDAGSMNTLPYIYMVIGGDTIEEAMKMKRVPWVASQTDMMAKDWFIMSLGGRQPK